eukprot:scaffold268_cov210-Ochromonas_danica.AAC.36
MSNPSLDLNDVKQNARSSRMTLRHAEEEVFRTKFQKIALEKCKDEVRAFANCVEKEGFWVVIQCRQQNKDSKSLSLLCHYSD